MHQVEPDKKRIIAGFEVLSKIGRGGMGAVFKARQISLDRIVALKILPPKFAQKDPLFVERFVREARASARINHPNVVQGIEVGQEPNSGLYYFAMEYVDGPTVRTLIKVHQKLEEEMALQIVLGVTRALDAAHRAGIVHRDIKPDNILLTKNHEPKLADLGLARRLDDSPEDTNSFSDEDEEKDGEQGEDGEDGENQAAQKNAHITKAGSAVGTPHYMAPEQALGESERVDIRSDLYALGTTFFNMVTGKLPFKGENSKEIMAARLSGTIPQAKQHNPGLSNETNAIILKLMQRNPDHRYQTPVELEKELEELLRVYEDRTNQRVSQALALNQNKEKKDNLSSPVLSGLVHPVRTDRKWRPVALASSALILIGLFWALRSDPHNNGNEPDSKPTPNLVVDSDGGDTPNDPITVSKEPPWLHSRVSSKPEESSSLPEKRPDDLKTKEAPKGSDQTAMTKERPEEDREKSKRIETIQKVEHKVDYQQLEKEIQSSVGPLVAKLDFVAARSVLKSLLDNQMRKLPDRARFENRLKEQMGGQIQALEKSVQQLIQSGKFQFARDRLDPIKLDPDSDPEVAVAIKKIRAQIDRQEEERTATDIQTQRARMEEAQNLEQKDQLGSALAIYRKIVTDAGQNTIRETAQQKVTLLERQEKNLMLAAWAKYHDQKYSEAHTILKTISRQFGEELSPETKANFEQLSSKPQIKSLAGTKEKLDKGQLAETDARNQLSSARNLLSKSLAEGYAALREVARRFPNTDSGRAAKAQAENIWRDPEKKEHIETSGRSEEADRILRRAQNYLKNGMDLQARADLEILAKEYGSIDAGKTAVRLLEEMKSR